MASASTEQTAEQAPFSRIAIAGLGLIGASLAAALRHAYPGIRLFGADIDERTDLAHAISCMRAIAEAGKSQNDVFIPQRVLDWVDWYGITVSTPPNEEHDPRQYLDEVE